MFVIRNRNVQQILPQAIRLIKEIGIERDSRNGKVLQAPEPVSTVYTHPCERVLFWPERDANPFFHLYEMLWMIAGRNDLAGPQRYVKSFGEFSDNGVTLHGAYGYRWRSAFGSTIKADSGIGEYEEWQSIDQLKIIAGALQKNNECRRQVLQMWDANLDLGKNGKDLPCNDAATFQIGPDGRLNLVVFCRSNDIIWGAYGANAVHFSFLLEYMANWVGVPVGTYTQISVNWHAYLKTIGSTQHLDTMVIRDPYLRHEVKMYPITGPIEVVDDFILSILDSADGEFIRLREYSLPWAEVFNKVLYTHHIYKTKGKQEAIDLLSKDGYGSDWERAGLEWLGRRGNPKQA